MEDDESHTFQNATLDFGYEFIGYFVVSNMTPPDEYVGGVENFIRQTAIWFVEGGGADIEVIGCDTCGDRLVLPSG